ncbi:hypothetical protein Celaphus_00006691 [Cervus elaphus hippelaphus]|uniref:GATOR complex protein NPRL3 n=1 Tax=Cervus elaphus hippelaphus TaxID=46360 RepID=A0A212D009_CEREH|nr:hypothetical protein Celaphus_00006691 [Cervus elaphus hippelaphus]
MPTVEPSVLHLASGLTWGLSGLGDLRVAGRGVLCTSGVVRLHVNSWLEVSFCLPHKIHYAASSLIPPEAIERSLKAIRPYHALLLLSDEKSLLSELPLDCSPALVRVIKTTSAVKNLQQLAQDADLALLQVFQLAAHLVYWGKAIVIYPLCENNVYMLSPNASVCLYSPLAEQFSRQFPSHDLPSVLAKFSLPVSLSEFRNPLAPPVQEPAPWGPGREPGGTGESQVGQTAEMGWCFQGFVFKANCNKCRGCCECREGTVSVTIWPSRGGWSRWPVAFLSLRGAGSDSAGSWVRPPASLTPASGPECVQVLAGSPEVFTVLFHFPCCDWVTHGHGTPVCPCLPTPPTKEPQQQEGGMLSSQPRGGLSALRVQATGRVPTEPTGWERRHSTVLPALGAPSDFWAPRLQTQLVQMVVWLLQRRLLVQLHTYVCLMAAPSEDEPRPREDDAPLAARPQHAQRPQLWLPKRMTESLLASLSEHERAAILSVPAAQNPEDLRMFARLLHYFRGRHHLEEIMYNENTRRSQLLALVDKFRSVLVVTTHEDPVIAVFQALLT